MIDLHLHIRLIAFANVCKRRAIFLEDCNICDVLSNCLANECISKICCRSLYALDDTLQVAGGATRICVMYFHSFHIISPTIYSHSHL